MYQAIADALSEDVEEGRLKPGERLPTHRELAKELGVNVVTVTRAYAEAARRGLVEGEVGRGTFVARREASVVPSLGRRRGHEDLVPFHFNLPRAGSDQLQLTQLYEELARDGVHPFEARYAPGGEEAHRAVGAAWLQRFGLDAEPERILVTAGGQHGLSVAFATLAHPGDVILTESLTYPGMKALASLLHLRLVPVTLDAKGLDPEAFEEACRRHKPKALYAMPTLQNPTGQVWNEERRRAVIEIARRYGVFIVEDETTAFLEPNPPPSLASLAPEQVFTVTSLSKSLGAGLRTGFLQVPVPGAASGSGVASGAWRERTEANLAALTWMAPPLMAEIAARVVRDGAAERVVAEKRAAAERRRALFETWLRRAETPSWRSSSFIWLVLPEPWRSTEFAAEARRLGVATNPAEDFVVGRAHAPHAVRLCLGTPSAEETVERGLSILAELLSRGPEVGRSLV